MSTKRTRNPNQENGAVEYLDDGSIQISDKTDRTKKLRFDPSNLPTSTVRTIQAPPADGALASMQAVMDGTTDGPRYYFKNTSTSVSATDNVSLPLSTQLLPGSLESTHIVVCRPLGDDGALYRVFLTNNQIIMAVRPSTNKFRLYQQDSGGTTFTDSAASLVLGKTVSIAAVRSQAASGTVSIYLNGILDTSQTGQTFRAPTGTPTIASVGDAASYSFRGDIYRQIHFNYAITDENKIRRYSCGGKLDFDDIGGSMTALVTGTDSDMSGSGSWIAAGGAITFTPNSPTGKGTIAITGPGTEYIYLANKLTVGKRYLISLKVRYVSGTNQTLYAGNLNNQSTYLSISATGTEATFSGQFVAAQTQLYVGIVGATAAVSYEIDDVSVIQLGAVLDLEPESATPSVWYDESGNSLNGTVIGPTLANSPKYFNTDYGPAVVKQELLDNAADKSSFRFVNSGDKILTALNPITGDATHTLLVTYKADNVTAPTYARRLIALGTWANNAVSGISISTAGYPVFGIETSKQLVLSRTIDTGWHTYVSTYDLSSVKGYIDGLLAGSAAYSGINLGNSTVCVGTDSSGYTNPAVGNISRAMAFNYVLSEDKIRRYSAGAKLDWDDIGGSQIDKSSGLNWTNLNMASLTPGSAGSADITAYTVNAQYQYAKLIGIGPIVAGKVYRVYFSGHTGDHKVMALSILDSVSADVTFGPTYAPLNAASGYVDIPVARTETSLNAMLILQARYGSSSSGALNIDRIVQLGAIVDFEPENITDTLWVDSSTNGLHGAANGAVISKPAPQYSSRNYIINGAFDFWQRGTTGSPLTNAGEYVSADRWKCWAISQGVGYSGNATFQQSSIAQGTGNVWNSRYALKVNASVTTVDACILSQYIEADSCLPLIGKQVTFSFKSKRISSNLVAARPLAVRTYSLSVKDTAVTSQLTPVGNGAVEIAVKVVAESMALMSTDYMLYSATFTVPTGAANGMLIQIIMNTLANGDITTATGDLVSFAEVQLNEGPVAAPFERAGGSVGGELALCQRYYEKSFDVGTAPAQGPNLTSFSTREGLEWGPMPYRNRLETNSYPTGSQFKFKVTKRAAPTGTIYGNSSGYIFIKDNTSVYSWATSAIGLIPSKNGFMLTNESSSTPDPSYALFHWTADAEI